MFKTPQDASRKLVTLHASGNMINTLLCAAEICRNGKAH